MEPLLKYDGFLPKADGDIDSASTLYRVNSPAEAGKPQLQCIALLVDVSGSMNSEMGHLIEAILSTVDIILDRKIASLDQIVLITFHSVSQIYSNFKNYDDFKIIVSNLRDLGGTNYSCAINDLTQLLEERKQVIAVMFSDGEPNEDEYIQSIEKLRMLANKESLLFHSIGLRVHFGAEKILRNLTTIGSTDGYYQSIDGAEIADAMNVLVDHFNCSPEAYVNGKRTRRGFIVLEARRFVIQFGDKEEALEVVNESFKEMLEKNSFEAILDAFRFLLEYYLRNESLSFDQAITIADNLSYLIRETENKIKMLQKEKTIEISNEKKVKLNSIGKVVGASNLKQKSEIIAEYNKKIQTILEENTKFLRSIHELKELCAKIQETLHKNRNISASVSGEVMNAVSHFRDNSIAQKRKHIARFSSRVREGNEKFQNIDQLLQEELDQLVNLESIPVPTYFENYSDPITLNDFTDIMLHKFGVFMLLINVERHNYGIAAPHKTKIIQIGGFSSSVLDAMMNNEDKSVFFDFRGIGFGNAAVPLWISDLHWRKVKHVFGPFVGYAVTGNELEYTKLQGMTLLALILLHLRGLETTEFNQQLIQMVSQTLNEIIDKEKWQKAADDISNSFENLNESKIPSIEVFLLFQEFIGITLPEDKALLLLVEQYRRKNVKYIQKNFEKLKSTSREKCNLLIRIFPKIFEQYLNISSGKISMSLNKKSMENYFLNLYNGKNDSKLLEWFGTFLKKLGPSLSKLASSLNDQQKIAVILSVHKCTCYKWDAIDEIPAGLSYDGEYPNLLLGWCRRMVAEKEDERFQSVEGVLFRILQTKDKTEAETLLEDVKRNSHTWAVMMKVLLLSNKIKRPPKLTVEQWEKHRIELYKEQIESMSIPLHFQLLMFCIFNSFNPEDWISSKMIWRPNLLLRRRIRAMFPEAPIIE